MPKLSKRDQEQTAEERTAELDWFANRPKSQHFAVGTRVVSNNIGGLIIGISKDGGRSLLVRWDNETTTKIKNPRHYGGRNDR